MLRCLCLLVFGITVSWPAFIVERAAQQHPANMAANQMALLWRKLLVFVCPIPYAVLPHLLAPSGLDVAKQTDPSRSCSMYSARMHTARICQDAHCQDAHANLRRQQHCVDMTLGIYCH